MQLKEADRSCYVNKGRSAIECTVRYRSQLVRLDGQFKEGTSGQEDLKMNREKHVKKFRCKKEGR